MSKPLAEQWAAYVELAIPAGAGATQRRETRIAFYAGAQAAFAMVAGATSGTEADGIALLDAISDELDEFEKQLREGLI